jgi:hypothetical protein
VSPTTPFVKLHPDRRIEIVRDVLAGTDESKRSKLGTKPAFDERRWEKLAGARAFEYDLAETRANAVDWLAEVVVDHVEVHAFEVDWTKSDEHLESVFGLGSEKRLGAHGSCLARQRV